MNTNVESVSLVLVTRPARQAAEWVGKLRAHAVPAQALPLIGIAETPDRHAIAATWCAFHTAAQTPGLRPQLMFVSPNAVHGFFAALPSVSWPASARALATGPGTVACLMACGVPVSAILSPDAAAAQFDSEALWARMRHEDWTRQPTWIARGDGGRDWLANTLRQAGATVTFVQAYARTPPQWGSAECESLRHALACPETTRWLISSSEALDHLPALLAQHAGDVTVNESRMTAFASHPRIAQRCERFGFGRVLCHSPTLDAVLHTLHSTACLQSTGHG